MRVPQSDSVGPCSVISDCCIGPYSVEAESIVVMTFQPIPQSFRLKKHSDCEQCDKSDVDTYLIHGNMWLCLECRDADVQVMSQNHQVASLIETARKVDESVKIDKDLFIVATVPLTELHGAILADDAIPANQKDYTLCNMVAEQITHKQSVVFNLRKELNAAENELRAAQVFLQTAAGKLHAEQREKFKQYDVNYSPAPVKSVKKASQSKSPSKPFKKAELYAAVQKWGIDAVTIQMVAKMRNVSPDEAGRMLANPTTAQN